MGQDIEIVGYLTAASEWELTSVSVEALEELTDEENT